MQILLACAKDMTTESEIAPRYRTLPRFQREAEANAVQLMDYSSEELQQMLRCNMQIATLNKLRYTDFLNQNQRLAAVLSYTGIAYKYLKPDEFSNTDAEFAQQHLWITSFLYGLLRPFDEIKTYRLEGNVVLPENDCSMFDYWKPLLTDVLIESVQADDGILINLASAEMKRLFDWRKVEKAIRVIHPEFVVRRGGRLKTVVVYAKMCRGAMARHLITNRCAQPDDLFDFNFEGFAYSPADECWVLDE